MTEDNRRRNIADELARAERAVQAAEALWKLDLHADSVSRSYYAVFHYLRALLFSRGLEPRSHSGAIHLFNTEFVRTGRLPSAHNRLLSGMQGTRELADYDAAAEFSAGDAETQLEDARLFGRDVVELLRTEGWVSGVASRALKSRS